MDMKRLLANPNASYAFENNGSGFRLLRILRNRRTHDFKLSDLPMLYIEDDESNEDEVSLGDTKIAGIIDLCEMFRGQSVHSEYRRMVEHDKEDLYFPQGKPLSEKQMMALIIGVLS